MATNTLQLIMGFGMILLCLMAFSSCKKVDDLLNPKSGDGKLEDLMTSGTWRIDTLRYYQEEQGAITHDTLELNAGTLQCFKRSAPGNPGYGGGLMLYTHKDTAGYSLTDSLAWYPGVWGSTSIEGKTVTFFYTDIQHRGMDGRDVNFTFIERDDNRLIIQGTRAVQDLGNGIVDNYHWHYCLTKQ